MGIDACFFLLAVILILTIPFKWLIAAVIAATVHEIFHIAAILMQGGRILGIKIGAGGTIIYTDLQGYKSELQAALAGPIGSFLLLSLYTIVPRVSLCAFCQGCFNLLPFFPLDGGRILHCLCNICFPQCADYVIATITYIVSFLVFLVLFFYAYFYQSLGVCIFLLIGIFLRKRPCKP